MNMRKTAIAGALITGTALVFPVLAQNYDEVGTPSSADETMLNDLMNGSAQTTSAADDADTTSTSDSAGTTNAATDEDIGAATGTGGVIIPRELPATGGGWGAGR